MIPRLTLPLCLVSLTVVAGAAGAEKPHSLPSTTLIEGLGSPAWKKRDQATRVLALRMLILIGSVQPHSKRVKDSPGGRLQQALEKARDGENPERSTRARLVLEKWPQRINDGALKDLAHYPKALILVLGRCKQVTDKGLANVAKARPDLQSLSLAFNKNMTNAGLLPLGKLAGLKSLTINFCEKLNQALFSTGAWGSLETLELGAMTVDNGGLDGICGLNNLTELDLGSTVPYVRLNPNKFRSRSELWGGIDDAGLRKLRALKKLRRLSISSLVESNGSGLDVVQHLPELRYVHFYGWKPRVWIRLDMSSLKLAPKLAELHLTGGTAERCGKLAWIGELKQLRVLALGDRGLGKELKRLKGLTNLTRLNIGGLDNDALEAVRTLTKLTSLNCTRAAFDGKGVARLGKLEKLYMADNKNWSDQALATVARQHPALKKLMLVRCAGVTDAGVAELVRLKKLRTLWITDCAGVTSRSVASLVQLKQLRHLWLLKTSVEAEGFLRLKKALPDCRVQQ